MSFECLDVVNSDVKVNQCSPEKKPRTEEPKPRKKERKRIVERGGGPKSDEYFRTLISASVSDSQVRRV